MRLLVDPQDAAAVVRALARPPIELRQVDLARVIQVAARRKLDLVSGLTAATESPQVPPEARERIQRFVELHRSAVAELDSVRARRVPRAPDRAPRRARSPAARARGRRRAAGEPRAAARAGRRLRAPHSRDRRRASWPAISRPWRAEAQPEDRERDRSGAPGPPPATAAGPGEPGPEAHAAEPAARGDAPAAARGGARERRADRRAPRRAAAGHRPRHLPRGRALPGAAQALGAAAAPGRREPRGGALGHQRAPARGHDAAAARDPPDLDARRRAAGRDRGHGAAARPAATTAARIGQRERALAGAVPAAQGRRPGAVGLGHRDLPQLPAAATSSRASCASPPSRRSTSASGSSSTRCSSATTPKAAQTLAQMLELLDAGWRRGGLRRARARARAAARRRASALTRYHERLREQDSEPVWFERPFSFTLGPAPPARARRPRRPPRGREGRRSTS